MALTLINDNLVLSEQQFAWVSAGREGLGYHHYYTGDGVTENPFTFNLSTSIVGGDTTVVVALSVPDNNKKFDFSLKHLLDIDSVHYKSLVDSSNKKTVHAKTITSASGEKIITGTNLAILPGTHVFRIVTERRAYLQSGLEVPSMPVLYPGTYVCFSGTALQNNRSWVQIRIVLTQEQPSETFFIRKDAAVNPAEIKVVVNVYERHYAIWTDEGFQAVYATKIREPRSFSIYEFLLTGALMCVPSS
ncbi:uncharacterized protein LOC142582001 isoform X2 [Dermacentor variabilis]|uniref:uncharacterized protein LOC142582001 isoform X2 n=1 Tax=Dermacentor variabilis TaxID=34621 RepID=UPI003F5CBBD3